MRRPIIIAVCLGALLIGGAVASVRYKIHVDRAEARAWREAWNPAGILGKSSNEVVDLYGKPHGVLPGPDGSTLVIAYKQVSQGQYCNIYFKEGKAVSVSFDFQ